MPTGKVKFFNSKSKFGFIVMDGTREEIFVRDTACQEIIKDNDYVEFETEDAPKGKTAINVRLIKIKND